MLKNSTGFTLVEAVLVIVALAAIGFAGWTWWQANQNTQDSQSDSKPAEENTEESEQHPDGFTAYQNQDIGLQMHYPEEWGDANFEEGYLNRKKENEPVASYFVRFTEADVHVRISPDNWEWTGPGTDIDSPVTAENFKRIKNYDDYDVTVYTDSGTIATIDYDSFVGNVKFEGHSKVDLSDVNASVVSLVKENDRDNKQCVTQDQLRATPECYSKDFKDKFVETLTSIEPL